MGEGAWEVIDTSIACFKHVICKVLDDWKAQQVNLGQVNKNMCHSADFEEVMSLITKNIFTIFKCLPKKEN